MSKYFSGMSKCQKKCPKCQMSKPLPLSHYERLQNGDTKLCDLETITIQVKPKCAEPFVIIAWYRPPNHKIDDILNIEKVYKTFDKTETEVIILGDVNCDDKNSVVAKHRGFYKQYQSRQLIKHPTRTTDKSSTLLDHFATNKPNFIILSGSKSIGFSDHNLIFGICKISGSMRKEPKIVNCRNNKQIIHLKYLGMLYLRSFGSTY